jgi:phage tail tape-measure protein
VSLLDSLQFKVGLDMRGAQRELSDFAASARGAMGKIGGAIAGLGIVAGTGALIKGFVSAGAEMEAFESRLTTLMGSASGARARLQELTDFAVETPFELTQIVAAETTLRGFGAAAERLMPGLIDMAAVMGGDLAQSATDLGKAWSQGAAGLESDAGRSLRKQIEDMSGVADATKMSLTEFREAMVSTLDTGIFAGGAAKLSMTFNGMVSNLTDSWGGFARDVADAGLFNNVKGALAVTLDLINANKEDTKL